ncbi:helix-turn-helix domain-containing protein [Listeria booriae]|uniref:Helix-turn-helix domain-containing protein n=1 Tax=Listeria booriae TaxID=1552123 RepID=A0A7X0Z1I7_9LIST|nr:Rgg/GadR/MutR family transcriptional regulator [Listeria booriae]MBC1292328.1 helix-turn-helix domain-containing protein [Listeria booriae]MBC1566443.1 helix-turn-helix domain-containing protein [Listeria booriae]MBC1574934.1 helix-turn-helix domain-containing protein [Listeria booriae]MBC2159905.1 helix-turn-helix domain-containing protein [Listeria booriae]MBC2167446.1 helix-turn-helix domain-containing protein [Listeria booriae]
MNFGATIKKIRKDKNLTQKELSDGILTRSHLSQIETNNYFPSYDKFFLLLDRLNVVFEEFLFIQNDQKMQFKQQIRSKISEAANLNDTEKLKNLAITAKDLHEKTEDITYYHYMLICKALISYNMTHTVNDEMIKFVNPIKEYLFKMDNWYLYELKLFNNIIYSLTVEEALLFSRTSLKRLDNFQYFMEFQHTEQHIYLNLSTLCMEYEDFEAAKYFAEIAIEKAKKYTLVYEKICSEMNNAIARIKLGEGDKAYEVIKKNMLIINYLEFENLHKHFSKFLKKFKIEVDV